VTINRNKIAVVVLVRDRSHQFSLTIVLNTMDVTVHSCPVVSTRTIEQNLTKSGGFSQSASVGVQASVPALFSDWRLDLLTEQLANPSKLSDLGWPLHTNAAMSCKRQARNTTAENTMPRFPT